MKLDLNNEDYIKFMAEHLSSKVIVGEEQDELICHMHDKDKRTRVIISVLNHVKDLVHALSVKEGLRIEFGSDID